MTLGGPPECPTRPFCQPGLEKTYGLQFKKFTALDAGGPLTKSALDSGAIDIGLVFSSDGSIPAKGYVVLQDDKHLQTADNIAPVIRDDKLTDKVRKALDSVSAALTSDKLAALNKQVDIDKADPAAVAQQFLKDNGLG
jgi:osmoprotectant transport system substrate-binding protein